MQSSFIQYKSSRIHYITAGTGPHTILCFHGYGEQGDSFSFLEKWLGDYRLVAIDLPFHGKTEWNEGLNFTIIDLEQIIQMIFGQPGLSPATRMTLMGFSLGGRMALRLYQETPGKIDKLVLLAPDGLKVNFWYWLATQTRTGNRFFRFTMKHPGWFFGFLKILNGLRLVNSSIFKFVNYYIGDKEVRRLLYARWTSLRKLRPRLEKIKLAVRNNKTPVRLVYGKHDRIILPAVGEKFKRGIEDHCTISIIPSGHQVLHEKHAADIVAALLR